MKTGFDNQKYLIIQSEHIQERISQFGGKLYLESGGRLFDNYHASRVLPGFAPDSKLRMLLQLADRPEIAIAINTADIEKSKIRYDLGITYDVDALRLMQPFRDKSLFVGSVVIIRYFGQQSTDVFKSKLENMGITVYRHYVIEGYPNNIFLIVSEEGFRRNDYIETSKSLVIVTAPGPGSGKMVTYLFQLYHENKQGIQAGYAKLEILSVWNLSLKHPVNLTYEATTADLNDASMTDPFHLEVYGETTVGYNRDVEIFPVLIIILEGIYGGCPYKSPTDMGVNMVGNCIIDDEVCREVSNQEIIRRYHHTLGRSATGEGSSEEAYKIELPMKQPRIITDLRQVVRAVLEKPELSHSPAAATELSDGTLITGKTSDLLGPSAAPLLNAVKTLGNIPDEIHLIAPFVIEPIQKLKVNYLGSQSPRLHTDEILITPPIYAATDEDAQIALDQLSKLLGCQAHTSVMLSPVGIKMFQKLGVELTSEPIYEHKKIYH